MALKDTLNGLRRNMAGFMEPGVASGVSGSASPTAAEPSMRTSGTPLSASERAYFGQANPEYLDGSKANPSFKNGVSDEARAFQESRARLSAPTAPAAPAAAVEAPTRLGRMAESAGRFASRAAPLARTVAGGVVATAPLTGFGDYKLNDPGVDSSAAGTIGNVLTGNFSDAAAGLRKGAVEAGLDSISGIAKTADAVGNFVGADLGLHRRFDTAVRGSLGDQLITEPKAQPAVIGGAPATAAGKTVENPYGGIDGVEGVTENGILTLRNTRPATAANQKFQADKDAYRQQQLRSQEAENLARYNRDVGGAAEYAQRVGAAMGERDAASAAAIDQLNLRQGLNSAGMGGMTRAARDPLDEQIDAARSRGSAVEFKELMGMKEAGLRDATQREQIASTAKTADKNAAVQMAQAEATRDTANATRQAASAAAQREQFNNDRTFAADQDKEFFAQREKSQKDLNEQLGTMFRTKDDKGNDVPDTARVADASGKIMKEVGNRISKLQAVPQDDPNYEQAQSLAQQLSKRGLAALDNEDIRELMSQAAIRDRAMQTKGMFFGSSPVDSDLSGYSLKRREGSIFGGDTLVLNNGTEISENDLRYTAPANAFFPDIGKVPTTDFEPGLKRKEK